MEDRWHAAALARAKKLPDLHEYLDPPRTRRLSKQEAAERRAAFEAAKAASDRIPVRPARKGVNGVSG